jgi:hypothetical protein
VSGLDAALADAALPGRVARRDGERAVLELEPADVGAALDALTARGASIDSLVPVRATLESLLLDAVDQGAPADPSRSGVYA